MFFRKLVRTENVDPDGRRLYEFARGGRIAESDLYVELLPYLYRFDPTLEDDGRAKAVPNRAELKKQAAELWLTEAGEDGVPHLGGVKLPPEAEAPFCEALRKKGYEIA
jgi:hypothetical protein